MIGLTFLGLGFLIGFLVAMPPGTTALMSYQRCLCIGRKAGFLSGYGVVTANIISSILAVFFLQWVMNFLDSYTLIVQTISAVLVLTIGILMFFKKVKLDMEKELHGAASYSGYYLSTFGIATLNPAFMLSYMGLLAYFDFGSHDEDLFERLCAVIGISLGSFSWWTLALYWVDKIRVKFTEKHLQLLSRLSGTIIFCIGLWLAIGVIIAINS